MSEKHKLAALKRWSNIPLEQRSIRMQNVAVKKWASISPEDRLLHSKKMLLAKKNKCQTQNN